jgi:hypothetical protein
MMTGDDGHCADAVAGSARTAAANNAGRTLVKSMISNSNHAPHTTLTPLFDDGILMRARCRTVLAE